MEAMKYTVIYEAGASGYSAYAPDLPGCIAAAKTLTELKALMAEAVALHIAGLRRHGYPVPEPTVTADCVEVA